MQGASLRFYPIPLVIPLRVYPFMVDSRFHFRLSLDRAYGLLTPNGRAFVLDGRDKCALSRQSRPRAPDWRPFFPISSRRRNNHV